MPSCKAGEQQGIREPMTPQGLPTPEEGHARLRTGAKEAVLAPGGCVDRSHPRPPGTGGTLSRPTGGTNSRHSRKPPEQRLARRRSPAHAVSGPAVAQPDDRPRPPVASCGVPVGAVFGREGLPPAERAAGRGAHCRRGPRRGARSLGPARTHGPHCGQTTHGAFPPEGDPAGAIGAALAGPRRVLPPGFRGSPGQGRERDVRPRRAGPPGGARGPMVAATQEMGRGAQAGPRRPWKSPLTHGGAGGAL